MHKALHSKSGSHNQGRILYIDDNEDHLFLVKEWLTRRHKELHIFLERDGQKALKRIKADPFDLILLDYKLGDLDGLQVLRRLKREGVECPIIILTGQGDEQTAARAIKLGAEDYFTKGSGNLDELVHMIEDFFSGMESTSRH
jgi:DNA-binding response OmpR family regulator